MTQYTPLCTVNSPYSGGCVTHLLQYTPLCNGGRLIHGGVLYPAETRMPRQRNSNATQMHSKPPKPKLGCVQNDTRMHFQPTKTVFECAKTKLGCLWKRKKPYSNTRKPIFECVFEFLVHLFRTYCCGRRRPTLRYFRAPRLDFGWSDMASGCVKQQYGWIDLLPRLHVTNVDRCYGMFVGLYPHNIEQLTHD